MALGDILFRYTSPATTLVGVAVFLISAILYLFHKPRFPKNAPPLTSEAYPLIGSLQFFTERWSFYKRSMAKSPTSNFSFYAGQWPVVAIGTDEGRKVFFESKGLNFMEGYSALLGGGPAITEGNSPFSDPAHQDEGFEAYFVKRLHNLLKGNRLSKSLPQLIADTTEAMDELKTNREGETDPFESIYKTVFRLTMRTVACNEIAEDDALLTKSLDLFERLDRTATPFSIMFPWMPTPAKLMRYYYGARLYMILKRITDDRKRCNRVEDDALQYLLDQGDSLTMIITFILSSLFAGVLNTGVNAAWILVYLANKPYWMDQVREEVRSVADRYSSDTTFPLLERLKQVPIEAWENEFPIIDASLKDSIRLQLIGTAYRKNTSGSDIALDKDNTEVIPNGAYATLSAGVTFYDQDIFENPWEWDPDRYTPERAEDKKKLYGWWGWGQARHPCVGMRFAKLEVTLIVAFFLAYFEDIALVDEQGMPTAKLPTVDLNRHSAHVPEERVYLKYRAQVGGKDG